MNANGQIFESPEFTTSTQIALRNIREGDSNRPPVGMFAQDIPPYVFCDDGYTMGQSDFPPMWRQLTIQEVLALQSTNQGGNLEQIKTDFTNANCSFVANRVVMFFLFFCFFFFYDPKK